MNTFIDQQLTQIKVREMLQQAAEARADRKAPLARSDSGRRKFQFSLAVAIPLILWILWAFLPS